MIRENGLRRNLAYEAECTPILSETEEGIGGELHRMGGTDDQTLLKIGTIIPKEDIMLVVYNAEATDA